MSLLERNTGQLGKQIGRADSQVGWKHIMPADTDVSRLVVGKWGMSSGVGPAKATHTNQISNSVINMGN